MRLPILCYHQVGPEAELGRRLNVSPERLTSHIRFFKRRGFHFVTAGSLAEPWRPKSICLTFDDAYVSTLTYGLEILLREEVAASIYAVAGKVGGLSDWAGESPKPLASWELLREAQGKGIEIGNHTLLHPRMNEIPHIEQSQEWDEADAIFQKEGIASRRSACWPYGLVGQVDAVPHAIGLALGRGWATEPSANDPLRKRLPRQAIAFSDSVAGLLYRLYVRPFLP